MKNKKEKNVQGTQAELPAVERAAEPGNKMIWVLGVIFLIAIIILGALAMRAAETWGAGVGRTAGKAVGTVKGSFEGITQGLASGHEAGREQGLSAEDTTVEIGEIKSAGKLDVLVAEEQIVNKFEEGKSYKALFVYKAKVTFSVDLEQAEIINDDSLLRIILPEPDVDFVIDENESQKMAEWQRFFWSGDTEAGYIGYMNSMIQIKEKSSEEFKNNASLMKRAKDSARKQVERLAYSACAGKKQIQIEFKGGE